MSLLFATQLGAVATLALAGFALATAVLAYMAWRKQSREVTDQAEMLKLQAEELRQVSAAREREAAERHHAQAVQVYMWETPTRAQRIHSHLRNTSQQPVYDVQLHWLSETETPARLMLPLMPGKEQTFTSDGPVPSSGPFASTAFFRDRNGTWWQTFPDGMLIERAHPPVKNADGELVVD